MLRMLLWVRFMQGAKRGISNKRGMLKGQQQFRLDSSIIYSLFSDFKNIIFPI